MRKSAAGAIGVNHAIAYKWAKSRFYAALPPTDKAAPTS